MSLDGGASLEEEEEEDTRFLCEVQRTLRKAAVASPICFPDDLRSGARMKEEVRILVRGE
jgi:hypothetical protein